MVETKASRTKKSGYKLFATELSGVVVGVALIILAYLVGQDRSVYPTTYIICISGYILGWIVALISTPMNTNDESKIGRGQGILRAGVVWVARWEHEVSIRAEAADDLQDGKIDPLQCLARKILIDFFHIFPLWTILPAAFCSKTKESGA